MQQMVDHNNQQLHGKKKRGASSAIVVQTTSSMRSDKAKAKHSDSGSQHRTQAPMYVTMVNQNELSSGKKKLQASQAKSKVGGGSHRYGTQTATFNTTNSTIGGFKNDSGLQ